MTIDEYFRQVETIITASHIVQTSTVTYDKRSTYVGFMRGVLVFLDGSRLHIREFVNVEYAVERYMYVFHYQRTDETLVFRYDNTPHHPELDSFPHHKHAGGEGDVRSTAAPDLKTVLGEVWQYLVRRHGI